MNRAALNRLKKALRGIPANREGEDTDSMDDLLAILDLDHRIEDPSLMTERQRLVLKECIFNGYSEKEVADKLSVSQQAISYSLSQALSLLFRDLTSGERPKACKNFSDSETLAVIEAYNSGLSSKEIAIKTDRSVRTIENKIRYLRKKGAIGIVKKLRTGYFG